MRGHRAGQLVVAERLEELGGRDVSPSPLPLAQRPVRDLPDQRLHEDVLAALRRPRVHFGSDQLPTYQRGEPRPELLDRDAGDRRKAGRGERLAQHRGVLQQALLRHVQRIQPPLQHIGDPYLSNSATNVLGHARPSHCPHGFGLSTNITYLSFPSPGTKNELVYGAGFSANATSFEFVPLPVAMTTYWRPSRVRYVIGLAYAI